MLRLQGKRSIPYQANQPRLLPRHGPHHRPNMQTGILARSRPTSTEKDRLPRAGVHVKFVGTAFSGGATLWPGGLYRRAKCGERRPPFGTLCPEQPGPKCGTPSEVQRPRSPTYKRDVHPQGGPLVDAIFLEKQAAGRYPVWSSVLPGGRQTADHKPAIGGRTLGR